MKKVTIVKIVRAFGAVSLGDLVIAGREWGDPFEVEDLAGVEELVLDGLIMRGSDGKIRSLEFRKRSAVPAVHAVVTGQGSEDLLHYFAGEKDFGCAQVVKALGIQKGVAKAMCEKLLEEGKLKVTREGRYFGRAFPYYKVVA